MNNQSGLLTVGYWRLQTSARCIPVTTPRRAANLCNSSPMMVAPRSTHSSWERRSKSAECSPPWVFVKVHKHQEIKVLLSKCFCNVSTDHMTVLLDHLETSFSSRLEVRFDVPWIQVSDAHQKPRSGEGPEFTETEHLRRRTAEFLLYHKNLLLPTFTGMKTELIYTKMCELFPTSLAFTGMGTFSSKYVEKGSSWPAGDPEGEMELYWFVWTPFSWGASSIM